MTRFSKGTLDHDSDGKMGGSRKASDMTKKKYSSKKASSKKSPAKKKAPPKEPAYQPQSYSQGRVARKRRMDRDYLPVEGDKKSFQAGWDYQDKIENS